MCTPNLGPNRDAIDSMPMTAVGQGYGFKLAMSQHRDSPTDRHGTFADPLRVAAELDRCTKIDAVNSNGNSTAAQGGSSSLALGLGLGLGLGLPAVGALGYATWVKVGAVKAAAGAAAATSGAASNPGSAELAVASPA